MSMKILANMTGWVAKFTNEIPAIFQPVSSEIKNILQPHHKPKTYGFLTKYDRYNYHYLNTYDIDPWESKMKFRSIVIYKLILVIDGWIITCEIALRRVSLDFTDHKSTLVHVMAWCCLAAIHYTSQCWRRSMSPNDVARPQWVKQLSKWPTQQIRT